MTTPGGAPVPGDAALAGVCAEIIAFMAARARTGDQVARRFHVQATEPGHPVPALPMVRSWLANCAGERRLIRPDAAPSIATRIIAALRAAEARQPGSTERVWTAVVRQRRGG